MLIEACHLKSVTKSVDLFKNTIILSLLYSNSINNPQMCVLLINKSSTMCSINLNNDRASDV